MKISPLILATISCSLLAMSCAATRFVAETPGSSLPVLAESGAVPAGTLVPIVASQQVSSATAVGKHPTSLEEVAFVVASDVVSSSGKVLIAKGTPVRARVTRQRHRRIGQPGTLEISPLSTTDRAGHAVALSETARQYTGKDRMPGSIVGGVIILFPLLMEGGDVALDPGAGFTATTR